MAATMSLDEFSVWIGDNVDDALGELSDGRKTLKSWMADLTVAAMEIADTDAEDEADDAHVVLAGDVGELDTDLDDEEESE